MTHLHDPMVIINDQGLIEVRCRCGRMRTATGAKRTCVSVWDSHLALEGVSPKNAGSLNMMLNAIMDTGDGPATWRDLAEFPPDIAAKIRQAREEAASLVEADGEPWNWVLPAGVEEFFEAREEEARRDRLPISGRTGEVLPADRPRPRPGQLGKGRERVEMAEPARAAFVAANIDAVHRGMRPLNSEQKLLMERTIQMAAGSVELDIFTSVRLRQEFARAIGANFDKLDRSERWMARLLDINAGARWRFRKTLEICIAQGTTFRVPASWQQALDAHHD